MTPADAYMLKQKRRSRTGVFLASKSIDDTRSLNESHIEKAPLKINDLSSTIFDNDH
jgi:hypothetical protein